MVGGQRLTRMGDVPKGLFPDDSTTPIPIMYGIFLFFAGLALFYGTIGCFLGVLAPNKDRFTELCRLAGCVLCWILFWKAG